MSKQPPPPNRPEPPAIERKPITPTPQAKPAKPKPPKQPSRWPWGKAVRTLVSLAILFHVVAVFSAPWFIQLSDILEPALPPGRVPRDAQGRVIPIEQLDIRQYPPQRPLVPEALASDQSPFPLLWHYTNLLYINNGYDFFSPDPSISHLIRYEVYDAAGQSIAKGELPNKQQQWPRLLYHRYMMLVDQSSDPRQQGSGWEFKIADRLLAAHNGERVRLVKVRHHLLTPGEVLAGRRLNEDSTYEILGELNHHRAAPQPAAGESVALPGGAG